ncbi:hypothetical protein EDD86DRAFT_245547 [Gorgonomyces haynaldii]|nr:hypothetical protein EDD86DRAFT_245547 [Gorgonomyces haynaldii]
MNALKRKKRRALQKTKSLSNEELRQHRPKAQKSPHAVDEHGRILERPDISYTDLIIEAILTSESRMLSLGDIYEHAWKNSIRHNLSVQKIFVRTQRPGDKPGKGGYWALTDDVPITQETKKLKKIRHKKPTAINTSKMGSYSQMETPISPVQTTGRETQSMSSFPQEQEQPYVFHLGHQMDRFGSEFERGFAHALYEQPKPFEPNFFSMKTFEPVTPVEESMQSAFKIGADPDAAFMPCLPNDIDSSWSSIASSPESTFLPSILQTSIQPRLDQGMQITHWGAPWPGQFDYE